MASGFGLGFGNVSLPDLGPIKIKMALAGHGLPFK